MQKQTAPVNGTNHSRKADPKKLVDPPKPTHLLLVRLGDIDKQLTQAMEDVERGDLDAADLPWENELDSRPPRHKP